MPHFVSMMREVQTNRADTQIFPTDKQIVKYLYHGVSIDRTRFLHTVAHWPVFVKYRKLWLLLPGELSALIATRIVSLTSGFCENLPFSRSSISGSPVCSRSCWRKSVTAACTSYSCMYVLYFEEPF